MAELFDSYRVSYNDTVEDSIRFSGLRHDFFLRAKADLLEELLASRGLQDKENPARALDIGCGVGALHPYLRALFPNLQGCDISAGSIARAREDNPWATYTAYQGLHLPYPDAAFDLAFAVCVAHHVPPADWLFFFGEMRRVVRPGGIVCIIEHNPYNPLTRLAVLRCPFDADAVLISRGEASRRLRDAGLSEIESRHFLLFPFANPIARRIESWLSGLPAGAQYACSGRV
jgi:SAM-dependent methyltransferase